MEIPEIEKLSGNFLGRLYIQKHYPEFYQYLLDKYKHIPVKKFSEYIYLYHHDMSDRPTCKCCGNTVNYIDFVHGYRTYCSVKCQTNSQETIEKSKHSKKKRYGEHHELITLKTKQTKSQRYGDPNYNNMEKNRQTCLERYSVERPLQSNEIKERMIEMCIERYGVDNPMKNKEIAKRSIENKIGKYGADNISNQKKTRQTCQDRYGVDNVSSLPEIVEKIESTKEKKYGDPHYSNREKAKQTIFEKYAVENASSSPLIREKVRNTNLIKYGVDNVAKVKEFQNKAKQTSINRYGEEYYTQTQDYKQYIKKISGQIQEKIYNTKKANDTFNSSSIEEQFEEWLNEHNIIHQRQYKSIDYPFNCDFYFPDKNLYLEIQGYWSHGGHPYDPNNSDDIKTVETWKEKGTKQYLENIQTWTVRDPLKRQWAIDHNLNWKEVFTCEFNELMKEVENIIS